MLVLVLTRHQSHSHHLDYLGPVSNHCQQETLPHLSTSRLEMSIGIILACVPAIRPIFQSDFLPQLRSRLSRYYSKGHHTESNYVEPNDYRQRLHSLEDPSNVGLKFLPNDNNKVLPYAYGARANAQNPRKPQPEAQVHQGGISKTTEFQLSILNQ